MQIATFIPHGDSKWCCGVLHEHPGTPALELADAGVLVGKQAPCIFAQAGVFVQVDKEIPLVVSRGIGVRNFISNPSAPGVHGGVGQVDAVAGVGQLVSGFRYGLDGQGDIIEAAPAAKSARRTGQGDGHSAG